MSLWIALSRRRVAHWTVHGLPIRLADHCEAAFERLTDAQLIELVLFDEVSPEAIAAELVAQLQGLVAVSGQSRRPPNTILELVLVLVYVYLPALLRSETFLADQALVGLGVLLLMFSDGDLLACNLKMCCETVGLTSDQSPAGTSYHILPVCTLSPHPVPPQTCQVAVPRLEEDILVEMLMPPQTSEAAVLRLEAEVLVERSPELEYPMIQSHRARRIQSLRLRLQKGMSTSLGVMIAMVASAVRPC